MVNALRLLDCHTLRTRPFSRASCTVAMAAMVGLLAGSTACTNETLGEWWIHVPVEVVASDEAEDVEYVVVLYGISSPIYGGWYPKLLDMKEQGEPGVVVLDARLDGGDYTPFLRVGAWQDLLPGGTFDGADLEPCAMAELEEPYTWDEPILLAVEILGCDPLSDYEPHYPGWPDYEW